MATANQQGLSESEAKQRVQSYMLDDEEISYSLRLRPTGPINYIKSLAGFGVTHWYITNQRLIEMTRVGGGFTFKDSPHSKISSVGYGTKVSLPVLVIGGLFITAGLFITVQGSISGIPLLLIGLASIWYAYWKSRQVLTVKADGNEEFTYGVSQGEKVDGFIWYLHAERSKHIQ